MRDTRVLAGACLIVATTILSALFMTGPVRTAKMTIETPTSPATPSQPVTPSTTTASNPTSTPLSAPTYPTTLSEQLSSVTVSNYARPPAIGITMGIGKGHAYGLAKQAARATTMTMIEDTVTITSLHGTIPGHMDRITLQAFFNGNTNPFCTSSATFDATGLTSYTTTFSCNYLGAGTYNFKVTVYDDNGTVIGDPTTSMAL